MKTPSQLQWEQDNGAQMDETKLAKVKVYNETTISVTMRTRRWGLDGCHLHLGSNPKVIV